MSLVGRITSVLREHLGCKDCTGAPSDQYTAQVAWEVARAARPRVETTEQLDALPHGSVVRAADGNIYEKDTQQTLPGEPWWPSGHDVECETARIAVPATLLWHPGDTNER